MTGQFKRSCATCLFKSDEQVGEFSITKAMVCHYGPPALIPVQTPQGPALMSAFPTVQAAQWCHQYRPELPKLDIS